jgi:hypothetical protein
MADLGDEPPVVVVFDEAGDSVAVLRFWTFRAAYR